MMRCWVSRSRSFVIVMVLRTFTEVRLDRLTAYAYPPYTVSVHRTSSCAQEAQRGVEGGPSEAESGNTCTREQPAPVADRRDMGGHPRPRVRCIWCPAQQRAYHGLRFLEQPRGEASQDDPESRAAPARRHPGDLRDDGRAGSGRRPRL